jgi:hypothetical protein
MLTSPAGAAARIPVCGKNGDAPRPKRGQALPNTKEKKMKTQTFTAAMAAPFLMAALSSVITIKPASAQVVVPLVESTYPGSMCRAANGPESDFQADALGQIFNFNTTFARQLVCPIPNDTGRRIVGGRVDVYDQHSGEAVGCAVREVGRDNTVLKQQSSTTSTGASPLHQTLDITASFTAGSHLVLACQIPAAVPVPFGSVRSGIASYTVIEDLTVLRLMIRE